MKMFSIYGTEKNVKKPLKYMIDWDAKSASKFQKNIKDLIKIHWEHDIVFEEFPVIGSRMTLDFYNASKKIALEVDGKQHYEYNKHMHQGSRMNFLEQVKRDGIKESFCEINNILLCRILYNDKINQQNIINFIQ